MTLAIGIALIVLIVAPVVCYLCVKLGTLAYYRARAISEERKGINENETPEGKT